jgi:hypothetical protein
MKAVALVGVLLALAVPGTAAAKRIAFHSLGTGTGWGASDGVRFAMFPTKRSEVVIDTHGGRLATRRVRLLRCSDGALPWDYVAGGARIVGQCSSELVVQRISDGRHAPAPYVDRPGGFFDYFPNGSEGDETHGTLVGSRWIEASVALESSTVMRYLDWRTGESRDGPASPDRVADVNKPGLIRRLCSPITRAAGPFSSDPLLPLYYDGKRALLVRRGGPNPHGDYYGQQVAIQACGQATPRVLANCDGTCRDVQYARGVATWSSFPSSAGGFIYAYSVGGNRLYRWPFTRFSKADFPFARIWHAGRQLFVTTCHGPSQKQRCPASTGVLPG